jgi:hypothetical protein
VVLARYNIVGKTTAMLIATSGIVLPVLAAVVWLVGGADSGPVIACLAVVWLGALVGFLPALRAVSNILNHQGRAVFVEQGRLHYDAPGMIGSLSVQPSDIAHARTTTRKRYQANAAASARVKPVWVVEVGRKTGKPRDIAVYALDVSPEALAAGVADFAAGKSPASAPRSIVQ